MVQRRFRGASKRSITNFESQLIENGIDKSQLAHIEKIASNKVDQDYEKAVEEEDPSEDSLTEHIFAPTEVLEETGERSPDGKEPP